MKPISIPQLNYRCTQTIWDFFSEFDVNPLTDKYIYIDRGSPILAVGHMDTVWTHRNQFSAHEKFSYSRETNIVHSPSLDDRLGLHMILDYLPQFGLQYDVLLTLDEEIGQSTASLFKSNKQYHWMFEIDRTGGDVVLYDYHSYPFVSALLNDGDFKIGRGSFTDISYLTHLNCAGVNIGCGYHAAHTLQHYVDLNQLYSQMEKFVDFYDKNSRIGYGWDKDTSCYCVECKQMKVRSEMWTTDVSMTCLECKSKLPPTGLGENYSNLTEKCDWCATPVDSYQEYFYPTEFTLEPDSLYLCNSCLKTAGYEYRSSPYCHKCDKGVIWPDVSEDGWIKCPSCDKSLLHYPNNKEKK